MIQVKHPSHRNLNLVFDELLNNFPATWGRDFSELKNQVPANVYESNDGYHLELLAPGRSKEDFKVNIDKDLLTISFEKNTDAENSDVKTIKREFSVKSFKRSFSLDEKVNTDAIQAKYENGVLKFYLPKKEEVKVSPKEISIQ